MVDRVAVIGAGMAGLAAARRLREAGVRATLFDKSRGLGGRMATRRMDGWRFDHGAQYLTARGPRLAGLVEAWCRAGTAAPWFEGAFVGVPGMSAPLRTMLDGETVVTACPVARLTHDRAGWSVHTADGPVATDGNGRFAAVIVTVPAPQAVPLLESAGIAMPELERVRHAPCWALMLAFAEPVGLDADCLRIDEGEIAWMARDGSKPGRAVPGDAIVVHAAADWSRRHLEWPADRVVPELLERFRALVGSRAEPELAVAHRWRFAQVEVAADRPCLWDAERRLALAGDWCLGPRVEAAFDSGEAAADRVLMALDIGPTG